MKTCHVNGCTSNKKHLGWCLKHYTRWRRHGDPLKIMRRVDSISWEFLLSNSVVNPDTGCIEWQKSKSSGYGNVTVGGRSARVHRLSYTMNRGSIDEGLCVLHTCDNTKCINPEHLWLGTLADNVADMVSKNRHVGYRRKHGLPDKREI